MTWFTVNFNRMNNPILKAGILVIGLKNEQILMADMEVRRAYIDREIIEFA